MAVLGATAVVGRTVPLATSPSRVTATPAKKTVGTLQCLIVSTIPERRVMLEQAAQDGGWETIVCPAADAAWSAVKRQRFQLALIDLDSAKFPEDLKSLTEEVAGMRNTLLVLCGNEGVALEEIWARQLGAWLYLPGVSQGSDVSSLCEQARPVAEKLLGRTAVGAP